MAAGVSQSYLQPRRNAKKSATAGGSPAHCRRRRCRCKLITPLMMQVPHLIGLLLDASELLQRLSQAGQCRPKEQVLAERRRGAAEQAAQRDKLLDATHSCKVG